MIPFTENELAAKHAFAACKQHKARMIHTGILYSNAIRYCGYNGNYTRNLARVYNTRKAIFYASAHDYINRYGAAQVF